MSEGLIALAVLFILLVGASWWRSGGVPQRNSHEWTMDLIGLLMQGVVVPVLQITVIASLLMLLAGGWHAIWPLPAWKAVLLNLVIVDYLYYWNHRLLHGRLLWPSHRLHHTATGMDVLVTARNTVWTPFVIIYLWINALIAFLLVDPVPFLAAATLTAGLDLWRHSTLMPRSLPRIHRALATILITPAEHAWHHASDRPTCNYGANLSWWDRLHGTYRLGGDLPPSLGVPWSEPLWKSLILPSRSA